MLMKKTEYITYRTTTDIRKILMELADDKKWSLSQLTEEIVKDWLQARYPERLEEGKE